MTTRCACISFHHTRFSDSGTQKVTTLSDGGILAVAGLHDVCLPCSDSSSNAEYPEQLTLLSFPSLSPIAESIHTEKEIYGVSFTSTSVRPHFTLPIHVLRHPTQLIIATTHDLLIYTLPDSNIRASTVSRTSNPKGSPKKRKKTKANGGKANVRPLVLEKRVDVAFASTGEGSMFRAIR